MMKVCKILAVLVMIPAVAQAAIIGTALGSGARAPVLGGYAMTPFAPDPSPVLSSVTSVPAPLGVGPLTFSGAMTHRRIGSGWASWSGGYTGDVYYTGGPTSMSMTLPGGTAAFILYAEPNPFLLHTITATANDGTSVTQSVHGSSGASGYGFHISGTGSLTSITVSGTSDWAWGEFSMAIPEPATLSLLSLGALTLIRRR
jgi:hypothetical protein